MRKKRRSPDTHSAPHTFIPCETCVTLVLWRSRSLRCRDPRVDATHLPYPERVETIRSSPQLPGKLLQVSGAVVFGRSEGW